MWTTAIHESGHAVAAHLLQVPFNYITIRPALGRVVGHVATEIPAFLRGEVNPAVKNRASAVATVLVAGEIAERELACVHAGGTRSDYEKLDLLLGGESAPDEQKRAATLALEQGFREFLRTPEPRIMIYRLAAALTRRITLNHADAVRAMLGELEIRPPLHESNAAIPENGG